MSDSFGTGLPLTAAQSGMWLAQQVDPGNPMYGIAECVTIHGPVALGVFESTLRRLVAEADALRVRFTPAGEAVRSTASEAVPFAAAGEEVRQVVPATVDWSLRRVDLSAAPDPAA